jgi:uncharacterized membrane protein YesL
MDRKEPTTLYQKINTIADWIIRLVMINVLVIITSLPIITLFPSLSAGYKLFHKYINHDEVKLFNNYFKYFSENFKKKLWLGLVLIMLIILGYINTRYYVTYLNENTSWFYIIGYYITLTILLIGVIVNLYALTVITFASHARISLIFKFSLYLSGKFFGRTLLLFLTLTIPFLLMVFSYTQIFMVFIGVSLPLLLNAIITNKITIYIKELMNTND